MAYVERLREELMESLGIGVERRPSFTSSGACQKGNGERSCEYERDGGGGAVAGLGGKVRRRSISNNSNNSNNSSKNRGDDMMVMSAPGGHRQEVPRVQQQQQHTRTTEQDPVGYNNSSRTRTGGGGIVDRKRPRSASATSRAFSVDSCRGRPASASLARHPVSVNDTRMSSVKGRKSNKDMDVLLEICRDQGRGFSMDPADFDSSISAICNLPIGPFAGASRKGWGTYFRELHGNMRASKNMTTTTTTPHQGGPLPMKRTAVRSSPARARRRPPERRGKWGHQHRPPPATQSARNNRSGACRTAINDKQQRNDPDGLAASRAKAARRAEKESVVWRMVVRLQTLWQELKIPEPDRKYITATYLGGSGRPGAVDATGPGPCREEGTPTSDEVNLELVRQIRLLLDYRAITIKVLRSVNLRESRLTEVEQALQAFQWHRGRDTDAVGLVAALAGLRSASLGVIRAVVEWRQKLWQPRAFCWRGVNYLEKMSRDTLFLRSPVGRSLLASVGLGVTDMTFVLFPSADEYDDNDKTPGIGHEGQGEEPVDVRAPPPIVRLTPKAGLASEYRAQFFEQPIAAAADGGVEAGGEGGEGGFPGNNADREKGREVEVVVQEAALQRRVEAERARLATKGCFVPLLRWLPVGQKVPCAKTGRASSPAIPPPAEPARETNIDSGNDGCTNQSTGVARGPGLPPAAGSTLPISVNASSTAPPMADNSRQHIVERSASTAQELGGLASGESAAVVGESMSLSQGAMLSERNSIVERDNENETTSTPGAMGRLVEGEEEEEAEEKGGGGHGRRVGVGKGGAPSSDSSGQTRLRQGDDGKRWEPDDSGPHRGGDGKGGEVRADSQSRLADNFHSGSQPSESEHFPADLIGTAREKRVEPREPRIPPEEAEEGNVLSTRATTRERIEGDGFKADTGQATNKAKPSRGAVAADHADSHRGNHREGGQGRREAGSIIVDEAAGRVYTRHTESGVDGVHKGRSSEMADKLGVKESNGNSKIGGGGGDGGDDCGGRETDRGRAQGTHSGEGNEQREESVAPSVTSYDNDFEDDAQDSPLSRSEGGTTTGSCLGSSGPVVGVQGVPVAKECADAAQTAGCESDLTEGGRAVVAQTEQERRRWRQQQRQEEREDAAATQIQRLVRIAHQQGTRGRRVESGEVEEGATNRQAWLAAWRARRETQVNRAETDAAIRMQSTARAKRASDEVNERRSQRATRILDATVNFQAFARRWRAYKREAVQEVARIKKQAPRRTKPGTSPEQQKTFVDDKEERNGSSSMPDQAAILSQRKEERHQSPKSATMSNGAESSVGSGQELSNQRESAKERKLPDKTQGGSSAVSSSSKGLTSNNSYSPLTSPGGRHSPSSGSEGSSLSGLLGSLNSSVGDDIIRSSTDSDVPTGGAKHRLGERENRRIDGGREGERPDIGSTDSDEVPPSSSSRLVEVAAAADDPTQLQRKEGITSVEREGEDPRTMVQTGDALHATGGPQLLSLSLSIDGEEPTTEEARQDGVGGGFLPSFSSDPPTMPGAINSALVALSPVPEERAPLATTASVSEYGGSDDLNFEALSSSRDSESVWNVGKKATKATPPTVDGADIPKTHASGTAGKLKGVPDSRRDKAVEKIGDESDDSIMSLSSSSGDS